MAFTGEVFYVADEEKPFFAPMLPEEVMEKAELIIGCVLEDEEEKIYPGGVLAVSGFDEGFVEIDFLYVPKAERRKGIGREMVGCLKALMMNPELGIEMFLCSYVQKKETASLDAFFTAMGFEEDEGAEVYAFPLGAIKDKSYVNVSVSDGVIRTLEELPGHYFEQFAGEILRRFQSEREEKGEAEEKKYIPLENRSYYNPDYSFLYLDTEMRPLGCILVSGQKWGYTVEYLCSLKEDGGQTAIALIAALLNKANAKERADTLINLSTVEKSAARLVKKLCEKQLRMIGVAVTRIYEA